MTYAIVGLIALWFFSLMMLWRTIKWHQQALNNWKKSKRALNDAERDARRISKECREAMTIVAMIASEKAWSWKD